MLLEFSVGNFRSFKDKVTFSMVAANITAKHKKLNESNLFQAKGRMQLLRSAVLYGANASGKSNLIKAMSFMKYLVLNSSRDTIAGEPIDIDRFRLSTATAAEPTFFEVVFLLDGTRYRYGFEILHGMVSAEWLYRAKQREVLLFEREGQEIEFSKTAFKEGKELAARTRKNALFLSVVAQWNGEISQSIVRWFLENLRIISGLDDLGYRMFTFQQIEKDTDLKGGIIDFVSRLDTGILDVVAKQVEISVERLPANMPPELKELLVKTGDGLRFLIATVHSKYDEQGNRVSTEEFDMDEHESAGTQKIFSMAGPIMDTLQNGRVLVVDELDARLHPLITREIVKLFNSPRTNPHNAQLIFATHDTNLLSNKFFRRDQIWFTEKDRYGATDLYSLVEFKMAGKKVRNDASFEKDYILGRYGAIPFIGNLEELFGEANV